MKLTVTENLKVSKEAQVRVKKQMTTGNAKRQCRQLIAQLDVSTQALTIAEKTILSLCEKLEMTPEQAKLFCDVSDKPYVEMLAEKQARMKGGK